MAASAPWPTGSSSAASASSAITSAPRPSGAVMPARRWQRSPRVTASQSQWFRGPSGSAQMNRLEGFPTHGMPLGALREWRATPPAVGFPQKKVFEHKLRVAGGKRSSARWTPYLRIDAVRQRLSSNHLIERPAMGADKIDLRGPDERVMLSLGSRQQRGTAAMTFT